MCSVRNYISYLETESVDSEIISDTYVVNTINERVITTVAHRQPITDEVDYIYIPVSEIQLNILKLHWKKKQIIHYILTLVHSCAEEETLVYLLVNF